MFRLKMGVAIIVVLLASVSYAQLMNADCKWVADNTITVDGKLDEAVWSQGTAYIIDPTIPAENGSTTINAGAADGPGDISADFRVYWDSKGFYIGAHFKDDIHSAPNSADIGKALDVWMDDAQEIWVDVSFDDIIADNIPDIYGQYGYQLTQGYNVGSIIGLSYYKEDNSATVGTPGTGADFVAKGFNAPYSSDDGINFSLEATFTWAGDFMWGKGTAANGDALGFNFGADDNDASGATFDCALRWTGKDHNDIEGWAKMTLSAPISIKPTFATNKSLNNVQIKGSYDIFGRKLSGKQVNGSALRVYKLSNGKSAKELVLR